MRRLKPTHGLKSFSWTCCGLILSYGLTTLNLLSCGIGISDAFAGAVTSTVDILTDGGLVIATHRRAFGENRTDISDYSTTLAVLMKNSGAWGNSGLRRKTPDALRTYMDAQSKEKLKDCLRIIVYDTLNLPKKSVRIP